MLTVSCSKQSKIQNETIFNYFAIGFMTTGGRLILLQYTLVLIFGRKILDISI